MERYSGTPLTNALSYIKVNLYHPALFAAALFFSLVTLIFTSFHYSGILQGNSLMWVGWLLSVILLLAAFLPQKLVVIWRHDMLRRRILLIAFVVSLYFITHLWNFELAPWNAEGLFDDAAWDIYFAKKYVGSGAPFQAAFFDEVGYISREVVFHYYITAFFKLLGYNLLVFNISLIFLGFVTVLFTTLIVDRLFKNIYLTLLSAFVINFFPLHYNHIFMGHRYAIAAPLMVVSLYFLYAAFQDRSFLKSGLSAFFAALCWSSAIMGKQYLLGLSLAAIMLISLESRRWLAKENLALLIVWMAAFYISAIPIIVYILFNYKLYVIREQGLLRDFLILYRSGGFPAVKPYFTQIYELFFSKYTFRRQFLPDFYIIPLPYYLLLLPGLVIAFFKKRFEIVILAVLPTLAAFISGSYDFRVLLSVPVWVVTIGFSLNYVFKLTTKFKEQWQTWMVLAGVLTVLSGLVPSAIYTWKVSRNPSYLYLLPHKDVAVSRMLQDIAAGSFRPISELKRNEFLRRADNSKANYELRACPYSAYAIAHLYLQDFDDKKALSLCDQGIQLLKTPQEILDDNIKAISQYNNAAKSLKLVWEVSDKTPLAIDYFRKHAKYGSDYILTGSSDDRKFSLYVLTIDKANLEKFKNEVANDHFLLSLVNP